MQRRAGLGGQLAQPRHQDRAVADGQLRFVPWGAMDRFYAAVVESTEEAVANALVANEDMTGRDGHRVPGLPRDRVAELFRSRGTP